MDNNLYLNLIKRVITNLIYEDAGCPDGFHRDLRITGGDWPEQAHTMIGLERMDNIQQCAESVIRDGVPGDFVECGVWRGGAAIFMQAIRTYYQQDRQVWVVDSFEGLPPPGENDENMELNKIPFLACSLEQVQANFRKYELLGEHVHFLKGWFRDTLPTAPIDQIAVLRCDGDLYTSTMDILNNLYPKLSPGGYCIIDDYGMPICRHAVDEYRATHGIYEPLINIHSSGGPCYWRKSLTSEKCQSV